MRHGTPTAQVPKDAGLDDNDGDDAPEPVEDETLDMRHIALIAWTGLRGAVGMALALSLITNPLVPSTLGGPIVFMTAGLVICTLIINGISTRALVSRCPPPLPCAHRLQAFHSVPNRQPIGNL